VENHYLCVINLYSMATTKKNNYSESIKELESIIEHLEKNDIALEELTPVVKKATAIIQSCKQQLFETDAEIQKLLDDINV